ncbi:MAG: hypothetical protein KBA26_08365 [Candidatus Delongbacteria bacterium]|nr:hypothetical protein [Candidatus Delongbacteria bacterium]
MNLKWLTYPKLLMDQHPISLSDYPVPDYPQSYIRCETEWMANWKRLFPVNEISRRLKLDFIQMVHLRLSKRVLEKPIRFGLHLEGILQAHPVDSIDLSRMPDSLSELIRFFIASRWSGPILPACPRRKWIGYGLRIPRLYCIFVAGMLYQGLYFLWYGLHRRSNTRDFSDRPWVYCSYSRSYLLNGLSDQPILILPFSRIRINRDRGSHQLNPLNGYRCSEFLRLIREMTGILRLEKKALTRLTPRDYRLYFQPIDFYIYFQFPIALSWIRMVQTVYRDHLPERLVFTNGSNEITGALTSLQERPFRIFHYQHGQMQTPVFYRSYSHGYLTWTPFERDMIERYSYDRCFTTGFYPKPYRAFSTGRAPIHSFPLKIGIFTNPIDEVFGKPARDHLDQILIQLIKEFESQCRFTLNLHPAESSSRYQALFPSIQILQHQSEIQMAQSDIIVTVYSTILVEALYYHKPVLVYRSFLDEEETLIGKVDPRRTFTHYPRLKQIMNDLFCEISSTQSVDLQPEQALHHIYFGSMTPPSPSELHARITRL